MLICIPPPTHRNSGPFKKSSVYMARYKRGSVPPRKDVTKAVFLYSLLQWLSAPSSSIPSQSSAYSPVKKCVKKRFQTGDLTCRNVSRLLKSPVSAILLREVFLKAGKSFGQAYIQRPSAVCPAVWLQSALSFPSLKKPRCALVPFSHRHCPP